MSDMNGANRFKRAFVLRIIGVLMFTAGSFLALLAPLESVCFAWFSPGGRFHYQGFGYGSFMFVFVIAQMVVYLMLAALLIPLGYGHLRLRRWAIKLSRACLWAWLLVGLPVLPVAFFLLAAQKDMNAAAAAALAVLIAAAYFVLPVLLNRFYQSHNVTETVRPKGGSGGWAERLPLRILTLAVVYLFYIVMFLTFFLLNGFCPAFGTFLSGIFGMAVLGLLIFGYGILFWGLLRQKRWALWGGMLLTVAVALSCFITFSVHSYMEVLSVLAFPARELDFLDGIPLEGYHMAILTGLPFLAGLVALIISRKDFTGV